MFLGIFCFTNISQAANYYVDGSCASSGNGTTAVCGASGPWKTLAEANTAVSTGNHTINIAAGTYNEQITDTTSGSSPGYRYWKANGTVYSNFFQVTGNWVKIEGFTLTATSGSWHGTIHFTGTNCIALNNTIIDSVRHGILTSPESSYCTISGNTIARTWVVGIAISGNNHTVSNNIISDIRCAMGANSHNDANGIEFHGDGHTFINNSITGVLFANNPGYTPHIDAFQTYGPIYVPGAIAATNCVFEKNYINLIQPISGVGGAAATSWMLAEASYITIKNNISFNYSGVNTGSWSPEAAYNDHITIVNNTFVNDISLNTAYWPSAVGIGYDATNVTAKNNIFYNHYYKAWEVGGDDPAGLVFDYNLIYRSSGKYTDRQMTNDVWAQNPLFVNAANDWHLQSSSPAKNAGVTIAGVTDDYAGVARPQGAEYDIGAYEYIQVSDTTAPAPPSGVVVS